jgi:hypothetical protein
MRILRDRVRSPDGGLCGRIDRTALTGAVFSLTTALGIS